MKSCRISFSIPEGRPSPPADPDRDDHGAPGGAPETLVRLIEMDMDPYNFADALLGILAQRLARRLRGNCRTPYHPSEEEFAELVRYYDPRLFAEHRMAPWSPETMLMRRGGCERCNGTGYRGRIALHELIVGSENIKRAIKKGVPVEEIKATAIQEGMRTLLMDGVHKVMQGLTDLSNVLKVCASQKVEVQGLYGDSPKIVDIRSAEISRVPAAQAG